MVLALGAHSFAPTHSPPVLESVGHASSASAEKPSGASAVSWIPPWGAHSSDAQPVAPTANPLAPVKLEYVSPSAIETIDLCERKWAFVKLDRLDKGSMAAAELGSATHTQHERWFIDGTPYDLTTRAGELALATSNLLPDRDTPGLRVEQEMRFAWPSIPGGLLGGKIDLNWREPWLVDHRPHESDTMYGPVHIVLDHKTSGNVQEYGKLTRTALICHPQAPVYGAFGIWHAVPGVPAEAVELRWNYVNTKGKPKGTPSWHLSRPEEIYSAVETYVAPGARRILQIVDQANQSRAAGKPFGAKDLPYPDPGKKACFAFGGCPFKSVCGITPAKGIALMADQNPSTLDFLTRMGLTAPALPVQAAPPVQQVQSVPLPPPPVGYGVASLPSAHPAPNMNMGYGGQVNPPEGQLPAPPAVESIAAQLGAQASDVVTAAKTRKPRTPKAQPEPVTVPAEAYPEVFGVPSFIEQAMLAVLPSVAAALVPQILTGVFQPSAIALMANEIAKAAAAAVGIEQ